MLSERGEDPRRPSSNRFGRLLSLVGWLISPKGAIAIGVAVISGLWALLGGVPMDLVPLVLLASVLCALLLVWVALELKDRLGDWRSQPRQQLVLELRKLSHEFTSLLRKIAVESRAGTGWPSTAACKEVDEWQRRFPGDEEHQARALSEFLGSYRARLYLLLDRAMAEGIDVAEDREKLRNVDSVADIWDLKDRIVQLQWDLQRSR
jgi:hypothetical protein